MKKRTRYKQLKLRVTESEENQIRRKITRANRKTFQSYALDMLLKGKVVTVDYSELEQLRLEVNRIGQNVNQLAKYVNTYQELDQELFEGLVDEIKKMKKLIYAEFKNGEMGKVINGSDESFSD
ncbi:plasmid mobilization protein [Streptococcus sobrinus]|uniref:plasmid mobilization protein n=1 Tax=Streptococcus sobrinus TaxID=1310 RepID=UPI000516D38E|nr:plasmid mobilization relaxosome protein MobC [Streptococcus sobrinus]